MRGGSIAVVTQGTPIRARQLCDRHDIRFRCLADPRCETYRAFGLKRGGVAEIMGPEVALKSVRAVLRGNIGAPGGDIFQLGGTFVIGTDGIIRFAHPARNAADIPPMDAIVACL
jgi:peroxiredoxin